MDSVYNLDFSRIRDYKSIFFKYFRCILLTNNQFVTIILIRENQVFINCRILLYKWIACLSPNNQPIAYKVFMLKSNKTSQRQ